MNPTNRTLPSDWLKWLNEALTQHSKEKVCEVLVDAGFTAQQVKTAMGVHFPAHITLSDTPEFYAEHASPAFLTHYKDSFIKPTSLPLYLIDDVFTQQECDEISRIASLTLSPSKIMAEQVGDYDKFRTSRSCRLADTNSVVVDEVNDRICSLVSPRRGGSEPLEAQHYRSGEYFKPHHDYFVPGSRAFKKSGRIGGQRTWTCMIYIVCPDEGGETHFLTPDIKVKPRVGRAVIWNNLHLDGTPNPALQHQSLPVKSGNKQVLTKWFRTKNYHQYKKNGQALINAGKPVAHFFNR